MAPIRQARGSTAVPASGRSCPTCSGHFPAEFAVCPHDATPLTDARGRGEDPLVGIVLAGTYRIDGVLGQGGMARLYAASHLRLEARYAVKVIHEELASSEELLARFEREARAAARIHSEHIVNVIDVLHTPDGRPCIVTELLEGEDLQDRLDDVDRLDPAEAIPIARQICRGLAAAHDGGVVHRDLKPSNIFLCQASQLRVKVLDFGVAKMVDEAELTKTGAIVGTLAYMAPEQARRAADAGPLADVYAVGAALYRMVTGQPPYGVDPAINPLVLLLAGEPEPPRAIEPSVPVALEAVIQRAMARDPSQRPQSAAALEEELAALVEPEASAGPTSRPRNTSIAELERGARRARPEAVALAAASTASVGLYAAALLAALVAGAEALTGTERTLIAVVALTAAAAVAGIQLRQLRARWRSVPAVRQLAARVRGCLLAGLLGFGAVELTTVAIAALSEDGLAGRESWLLSLFAALAAAAGVWLLPRIRSLRR
jgi:serine/threonine-protein kinase